MVLIMNRDEFTDLRNIIAEVDRPNVTAVFNEIFSDNPPEGVSWSRSEDKKFITLNLDDTTSHEVLTIIAKYVGAISRGCTSIAAIPKLLSTLKHLGSDFGRIFHKK